MIEITIPNAVELFDSDTNQFINVKPTKIQLEHSLISLKKWEQKWHKPFLAKEEKTSEEMLDYIRCMTLNHGVDPNTYRALTVEDIEKISEYIKDPMTATWFSSNETVGASKSKKEIITAEIIYYWMITLQIPVEFQKWHLNQLLTLIKVVNLKNAPEKKMNKREAAKQRSALNAARRAKHRTSG